MYEFLGCYLHGDSCLPNIGSDLQQERLTKTRLRLQYTLELGYGLEVMWECEWEKWIRMDGDVLKTFEEVWYPKWPSLPTKHKVRDAVKDGSFFGLVRCDVRVPPELMEHFSEMTPLFGHARLGEEHLSPHMRAYVVSSGISMLTHRSLVGANRAEGMLLHSELLQWYLRKGWLLPMLPKHTATKRRQCMKSLLSKQLSLGDRVTATPHLHCMHIWPSFL